MVKDDDRKVLWCGNLSEKVSEDMLYELFLQAGPLEGVTVPKDREGKRRPYAFITFKHEESVPYTMALLDGIKLFGRQLRLQHRSGSDTKQNKYLLTMEAHQRSLYLADYTKSRDSGTGVVQKTFSLFLQPVIIIMCLADIKDMKKIIKIHI
ncbi:RNA-binding protein 7-like [Limulus polyphemus]|uniref:RNA-binding protein 7-like n=1 Tax=Limulus polyphemus TaxID=6850 RepID=A0ABM1B7K2_LIMPO|nr:RNA-binding protein 7-like [Limulus polyphemus]